MRISYHKDTDSLYIHLSDAPTDESEEVAEDTVLHLDEDGNVTGIEIYSEASERIDLSKLEVSGLEGWLAPTVSVSEAALINEANWSDEVGILDLPNWYATHLKGKPFGRTFDVFDVHLGNIRTIKVDAGQTLGLLRERMTDLDKPLDRGRV